MSYSCRLESEYQGYKELVRFKEHYTRLTRCICGFQAKPGVLLM